MTSSISLFNQEFSYDEILKLLIELDLLPLLVKRYIERKVSASVLPDEDQQVQFQSQFLQKENISTTQDLSNWLVANDISEPQLSKQLYHALQLRTYKYEKYTHLVQDIFIDRKIHLDKVMYSFIRTRQRSKAYELYLRIVEEEASFADLASQYSEGIEQQVNGLIGPIELGRINPNIAERLRISKSGQLWEPFVEDGWWVILRLEKSLPASLDDSMKERIINDLHAKWLRLEVKSQIKLIMDNNTDLASLIQFTPILNSTPTDSVDNSTSLFKRLVEKISSSKS